VLDAFEWMAGTFTLLDSAVVPDGAKRESIALQAMIDAAKKRAEASSIYPDGTLFRLVDDPAVQQQVSLTGEEFKLLFRLSSPRTFRDLAADVGLPRTELADRLKKLEKLGLVKAVREEPPAEPTAPQKKTMMRKRTLVGSLTPDDRPDSVYPLLDAECTIGRAMDNVIAVPDGSVSSKHARIVRTDDGFVIEDLQSRNGTFVNGERVVEGQRKSPTETSSASASDHDLQRRARDEGRGHDRAGDADEPMKHDLAIVGSGPAGLATAAHAQANGLSYVLLERSDHLSDTIYAYQARKFVMAEPVMIPARGDLPFEAGSRESILTAWQQYAGDRQLNIHFSAEVKSMKREGGRFLVKTAAGAEYDAGKVVLAMGTQGNPRKLGCPGDNQPYVLYRLNIPPNIRTRHPRRRRGRPALEIHRALRRIASVSRARSRDHARERSHPRSPLPSGLRAHDHLLQHNRQRGF
jgi:hypothetical protein